MTCDEAGKYGGPMNEGPVVRREEAGGRGAQCNDDGKTENPLLRTTVRNVLVQQGCTEDGERTEDHEGRVHDVVHRRTRIHAACRHAQRTDGVTREAVRRLPGSGREDFDKQVKHRQDPCDAGCAEAKIVSDGVPSRGALRGLHPKICFAGEGGTFASWTDPTLR